MPSLTDCLRGKHLVTVYRKSVDGYGIQGFLVGLSPSLMALEYLNDLQPDGLMVLRRAEISDVKRTGTDEFQERLIQSGTAGSRWHLDESLQLEDWRALITQLKPMYPIMALEREWGPAPERVLGVPLNATAARVEVRSFTGIARWLPAPTRLSYAHITCLQVGTRYLNAYQRYFEGQGADLCGLRT